MVAPEELHLSISGLLCLVLVYTTARKTRSNALASLICGAMLAILVTLFGFALLYCFNMLHVHGILARQPSTVSQMANLWSTVVNKDPNFAVAIVLIASAFTGVTWYIVTMFLHLCFFLVSAALRVVRRKHPVAKREMRTEHQELRRAA